MSLVIVCVRISISRSDGYLFIQRHLADTIDGVVGIVHHLRHTVLSTLHHHTTAEDTAEVGTLDGVHQTTSIDRAYTVLYPVTPIIFISVDSAISIVKSCWDFIFVSLICFAFGLILFKFGVRNILKQRHNLVAI